MLQQAENTFNLTRKNIVLRFRNLLVKTGNEWKDIADENKDGQEIINRFSLPLLALCTLATFLGSIFNNEGADFETALKVSLTTFLSYYGSFYLATLLINLTKPVFQFKPNRSKTLTLVAYSYGLFLALDTIVGLFPEFYPIKILVLYAAFLVWEGVVPMLEVSEEHRMGLSLISAIAIIILPFILDKVLLLIIPGNAV